MAKDDKKNDDLEVGNTNTNSESGVSYKETLKLLDEGKKVRRSVWYATHYLHKGLDNIIYKNENGTDGVNIFTPDDEKATDYQIYIRQD